MKWLNKLPILILAYAIVIAFWSLITPSFEFPDEQAHFGTVSFLLLEDRVPVGPELDMTPEMASTQELLGIYRNPLGQNEYTYHPEHNLEYSDSTTGLHELEILALNQPDNRNSYIATEAARYPRPYYDYEGMYVSVASSSDILTRLFAARLGGVVLSLFMAYFVYQAGLLLFTTRRDAIILTTMVMLQPMFSFVSAGINSDNLHNLLFTIVIYAGLRIVKHGATIPSLTLALVVSTLSLYAKPQGVLAIPIILLAVLINILKTKNWRWLFRLFILTIILIGASWEPSRHYIGIIGSANVHDASLIQFTRFSTNKLVSQNIVWYWGVFKWLGVVLPPIYWQVANRIVLVSGLGLFIYLYQVIKKKNTLLSLPSFIFLLFSLLIYTFTIYYFDWHHTKTVGFSLGVQARYFFPTIIAQMALLMTGFLSLAPNKKIRTYLQKGLVLLFLSLQLGGLWTLITSYYDTSSLSTFINQVSQYKPILAKGDIWYLYIILYIISLYVIARASSDSSR